jgi:hypothetical protein
MSLKWDGKKGEARRRLQGLWVWDRLGHECANAVLSRQRKEVPQMAVLSVIQAQQWKVI